MAIFLLIILLGLLLFLYIKKEYGWLAGFTLVYFRLLSTVLFKVGPDIYGAHSLILLSFYAILLLVPRTNRNYHYLNYYSDPVVFSVFFFTVVLLIQDTFSVYYDLNKSSIANFELEFFLNTLFPFFTLPFYISSNNDCNAAIKSFFYWGVSYLMVIVLLFDMDINVIMEDRMKLNDQTEILDPISLSRYAGFSTISSVYFLLFGHSKKRLTVLFVFGFALSVFFLLLAGQRGTIIGVVLSLSLLGIREEYRNKMIWLLPIVLVCIYLSAFSSFEVFDRFKDLENYQTYNRFYDYIKVWEIFKTNGWLYGLGSEGYYYLTGRSYPHNIILEHVSNYGLLGLLCIVVVIVKSLQYSVRLMKFSKNYYDYIVVSCWFMTLSSSFVSASINGNKLFYLFSGMIVISYSFLKEKEVCSFIDVKEDD
jgi:hypothetical protein